MHDTGDGRKVTRENIKHYLLTITIIYLITLIVTLMPALVRISPEENAFDIIFFGAYVTIPSGFIIIGAISQFYIHKFRDVLICLGVNVVCTIIIFVPFLLSFIDNIIQCILIYWTVFLIGCVTSLTVRQISEFINNGKKKK